MTKSDKNYYSVKELVNYIGDDIISSAAIYNAIKNGAIPCLEIGRRKLIPASWVVSVSHTWSNDEV